MSDHEHDRFLLEKEGKLIYGCVNPFCGHGDPALPHRWGVPMESDVVKLRVVSHKDRMLTLELTWKVDHLGHNKGEVMQVTIPDNLEDNKAEFNKIFHPEKEAKPILLGPFV